MEERDFTDAETIDQATVEPIRAMRGFDTLVEAIRAEALEEFPMDRSTIDYSFGDIEIEDGQGGFIPVRDLSEHLKADRFEDADALLLGLSEALASWKGVVIPLDRLQRPEDQPLSETGPQKRRNS